MEMECSWKLSSMAKTMLVLSLLVGRGGMAGETTPKPSTDPLAAMINAKVLDIDSWMDYVSNVRDGFWTRQAQAVAAFQSCEVLPGLPTNLVALLCGKARDAVVHANAGLAQELDAPCDEPYCPNYYWKYRCEYDYTRGWGEAAASPPSTETATAVGLRGATADESPLDPARAYLYQDGYSLDPMEAKEDQVETSPAPLDGGPIPGDLTDINDYASAYLLPELSHAISDYADGCGDVEENKVQAYALACPAGAYAYSKVSDFTLGDGLENQGDEPVYHGCWDTGEVDPGDSDLDETEVEDIPPDRAPWEEEYPLDTFANLHEPFGGQAISGAEIDAERNEVERREETHHSEGNIDDPEAKAEALPQASSPSQRETTIDTVLSLAAESLDRLGGAMCRLSRHIDRLR